MRVWHVRLPVIPPSLVTNLTSHETSCLTTAAVKKKLWEFQARMSQSAGAEAEGRGSGLFGLLRYVRAACMLVRLTCLLDVHEVTR